MSDTQIQAKYSICLKTVVTQIWHFIQGKLLLITSVKIVVKHTADTVSALSVLHMAIQDYTIKTKLLQSRKIVTHFFNYDTFKGTYYAENWKSSHNPHTNLLSYNSNKTIYDNVLEKLKILQFQKGWHQKMSDVLLKWIIMANFL